MLNLDGLNPMQQDAVRCTEGPLLVLAGAGSGKTSVLTHRIGYMLENGIPPFHILAITFTNKAAKEMRERIDRLTALGGQVWVSTFHSLCVRILRTDIAKINFEPRFTIYDADDSERLIKKCIRDTDLNDKLFPPKAVASTISSWKNELLSPQKVELSPTIDFREMQIAKVYSLYQKKLRENNALDFDDIIYQTIELFIHRPDVLEKYQNRFHYIMVDEYQDTNTSQYRLIRMLSQKHGNLCVVGDDDQSIYAWRGANIRNILDFEKDFPQAKVIKLEQNYRSSQTILNAANAVVANNIGRKAKALWTENPPGVPIQYFRALTDYEEASFVADTVLEGVKNGGQYNDYAVLYRTNAQSRSFEEQMTAKNIPYRLFGGVRFYDRKEIRDVLAYLRCVNNPRDSISLLRIINVPRRGIGDATLDQIDAYAAAQELSFYDALFETENIPGLGSRGKRLREFASFIQSMSAYAEEHTIEEVLRKILDDTNYLGDLLAEGTPEAEGRVDNVKELVSKAAEFTENNDEPSLSTFLEEIALVADLDNYAENDDTVVLMTYHSAKGLEFPVVFLVGFEEGIFPSYRSVNSGIAKDLEEERRICYVGITRAKKNLYITTAGSRKYYGNTVFNAPSRFLKEIPGEYMERAEPVGSEARTDSVKTDERKEEQNKGSKERKGLSQYAEINKFKNSIDISFGGKNYMKKTVLDPPKNLSLDFAVGDTVRQMKYGVGVVTDICSAGADYEVTVEFENIGAKKFMAHLSKLKKVEKG